MSPLCARVAAAPISRFDRPTTLFHVIAADISAYDTDVLDPHVVAGGGVMGTQLRAADLTFVDLGTIEGRGQIRTLTCPEVIETIQRNYFQAGSGAAVAKYVRLQSG
jgi:hypothetical protein